MKIVICASWERRITTRQTKTITSDVSCRTLRIRPYILLTSEVILRWITEVSAFR